MKNTLKTPKTDWKRVNTMTDNEIDYTEIPEATEEIFKIMRAREPEKVKINIALNPEIINFFKQQGSKYQSRINDVLLAIIHSYKKTHNIQI